MRIDFLAEDERHAEHIQLRITEMLERERAVLSVGDLDDITHLATQGDELTDDEVEGLLRSRDIYFINRLRRLRSA